VHPIAGKKPQRLPFAGFFEHRHPIAPRTGHYRLSGHGGMNTIYDLIQLQTVVIGHDDEQPTARQSK